MCQILCQCCRFSDSCEYKKDAFTDTDKILLSTIGLIATEYRLRCPAYANNAMDKIQNDPTNFNTTLIVDKRGALMEWYQDPYEPDKVYTFNSGYEHIFTND